MDLILRTRSRLSVVIVVLNEAHCLRPCLEAVRCISDEIIVLDCGSADGTQALARALGAHVVDTDWPGFGRQKNRGLDMATGDWILAIDADEIVSPALAGEVNRLLSAAPDAVNGYSIPYINRWCGRSVRFGDWGGKYHLRLFRRGVARFTNAVVHERVECPEPVGRLRGAILHDSIESRHEAHRKTHDYAVLAAPKLAARGRGGPGSASLHSAWIFLRGYVLRAGFLDGLDGLRVARYNAAGVWAKYRLAGHMRRASGAMLPNAKMRTVHAAALAVALAGAAATAPASATATTADDSGYASVEDQARSA